MQSPLLCQPLRCLGPPVVTVYRTLVVWGHAHLWCLRWLLWFGPVAYRPHRSPHVVTLSPLMPLANTSSAWPFVAHTRGALSPETCASGASPHIACARGSPPSENLHLCREIYSYGGPTLLFSSTPTMVTHFSCVPRPPPRFPWQWCYAPQLGTPLPSPSGSLHSANPSPLPRTKFQSLSLSASPCPSISCCGVQGGGADGLCSSHSALASSVQLMGFSP